jgi:hypothetical protein
MTMVRRAGAGRTDCHQSGVQTLRIAARLAFGLDRRMVDSEAGFEHFG